MVQDYLFNMEHFGHPTEANWRNANWGGAGKVIEDNPIIDEHSKWIKYLSAWEHHEPVIQKLSTTFPDILIEVKWTNESLDDFEHYTIQNGIKTVIANPEILVDEEEQLDFVFQEDLLGEDARAEYDMNVLEETEYHQKNSHQP